MFNRILILITISFSLTQEIFTEYLVESDDTVDVFWVTYLPNSFYAVCICKRFQLRFKGKGGGFVGTRIGDARDGFV